LREAGLALKNELPYTKGMGIFGIFLYLVCAIYEKVFAFVVFFDASAVFTVLGGCVVSDLARRFQSGAVAFDDGVSLFDFDAKTT